MTFAASPGVVVVLGGGGAKAAAHIGAYRAIREAGIQPERLVGTSMGAVIAALFAAGADPGTVLDRITGIGEGEFIQLDRFAFLRGLWARALIKPEPFRASVERLVVTQRFDELVIPLTVATTDLDTGELHWLGWGGEDAPLIDALVASCALSVHFPPVTIGNRRLGDGGLRAVVPLEGALLGPAKLVVAVDAGPGFDQGATLRDEFPPLVEAHDTSTGILMAGQTEAALALWRSTAGRPPLVYVRPRVPRSGTFRTEDIQRYVDEGYAATRAALADLPTTHGPANLPSH
ncbi:MAG: patatin-like phospholipase family protein [Gemmatimonadota bacterium]|nr:patatin-like phospholipase family protein [Gemmatimonadota bacterium]